MSFFGCFPPPCFLLLLCFGFGNSSFLYAYCPNSGLYDKDSTSGRTFRANLDSLLSTLTSNANYRLNGFYYTTAGNLADDQTVIHGLFLCRGDVNISVCHQCVATTSSDVQKLCPNLNRATFWYDECMLRFSNESIFSRQDTSFEMFMRNVENVTDTALLNQANCYDKYYLRVLGDAMDHIVIKAAIGDGKKFAVQEANFTAFQKRIYTLGQCTPDLSYMDCEMCLRAAIKELPRLCNSSQGGRIVYPSCNVRYETYRFYTEPSTPNLPPPPQPLPSRTETSKDKGRIQTLTIIAIVVPILLSILFMVVFLCMARSLRKAYSIIAENAGDTEISTTSTAKSLQYNFTEVQAYTNNFSDDNKIGEGGFGSVYKGTFPNGQDIAVKRLSRTSAQGAKEFRNEIALVAKLHHRNLVRLLGYCLEIEEKILIYEFVPNKSLDCFLFDPQKQPQLNWLKRHNIIVGIARGLLYLHEDSCHKIIHRDLKASNVVLDESMNPKIADFGIARLFEVDQSEANTSRAIGTVGYMSPEYALHGLFSPKSDVYSFGVLVLEIISGKKNMSSSLQSNDVDNLQSYAWRQWRDGNPLALVDPSIGESYSRNEVFQCIHIGLLCVQEDVEQRPTMASVVVMLSSHSVTIPAMPNPPAFFSRGRTVPREEAPVAELRKSSTPGPEFSIDQDPITELYPR